MRRDKAYLCALYEWGVHLSGIRGAQGVIFQETSVQQATYDFGARVQSLALFEREHDPRIGIKLYVCEYDLPAP